MTNNPWWSSSVSVAVGVILGYAVAEVREHFRRRRERCGHFEALAAELQICADMAEGYLREKVMAPSYRMPHVAYDRSLPALLVDGVLTSKDTNALLRYYVNALSFNSALDHAQATLMKKDDDRPPGRLEKEVRRAKLKAGKLQRITDTSKPTHYQNAIDVVRRYLPKGAQQRLTIDVLDLVEEEAD